MKLCSEWFTDEGFPRGKEIVSKVKDINDATERAVQLITGYWGKMKNEK